MLKFTSNPCGKCQCVSTGMTTTGDKFFHANPPAKPDCPCDCHTAYKIANKGSLSSAAR